MLFFDWTFENIILIEVKRSTLKTSISSFIKLIAGPDFHFFRINKYNAVKEIRKICINNTKFYVIHLYEIQCSITYKTFS